MDQLFGEGLFMTIMILIVVGLVAAAAFWMFRRSAGRGDNEVGGRSKQQRLGILEELDIDRRRSLILIRRDNAEHLIMVGGPTDIVIESGIAKGSHLQAVRNEPVREEAPPPREAREPQPEPKQRREKPARPVEDAPPPAAAQGSSRRQARAERAEAEAPARRNETGLAAAANALELALRKPFGAGGAPQRQDLDEDEHELPEDSAVTPFPAPAARSARGEPREELRDEEPYDLDGPAAAPPPPPPAAMPRFLGGGSGSRREAREAREGREPREARESQGRPAAAEGRERDRDRDREAGPRPTPFPSPGRTPRAAPPSPAGGTRERIPFGSSRAAAGGGGGGASADLVASRSERPAPLSLEDEMASLLDEISGVRERG